MNIVRWIKNVGVLENGELFVKASASGYDDIDFIIENQIKVVLQLLEDKSVQCITYHLATQRYKGKFSEYIFVLYEDGSASSSNIYVDCRVG